MGWGLEDKKPSMQAGGGRDVRGMKAAKAAAPCGLGQQTPTMPMAPAGVWGDGGMPQVHHFDRSPEQLPAGCKHPYLLSCKASLVTSCLHQTIQLLIEKKGIFFQ